MIVLQEKNMTDKNRQLQGKNLVVGLGKTGLSVVRFLSESGASVAVNDSRDLPPGLEELKNHYPDVARFTGNFNQAAFDSADRLIVNPGISIKHTMIAKAALAGKEIIGDIELFARFADKPVIAITGSNGKTTVTTLVGQMAADAGLSVGVGGNIGTPALDLLDQGHDLYVLELSSFQLETTESLKPVAAVVLNISEDHMDRYKDIDDYLQAKLKIYAHALNGVINLDDPCLSDKLVDMPMTGFSVDASANDGYGLIKFGNDIWIAKGQEKLLKAKDMKIAGKHNLANAMAALALGDAAGLPMGSMLQTIKSFPGLPHRTQFVGTKDGVDFYNDSKATNVGAMLAALDGLADQTPAKTIVILGGDCKQADFSGIATSIRTHCRAVVLMGRDATDIERHLPDDMLVQKAASLKEAVQQAFAIAQSGDRVLLSPACASFDMFKGFEDRGNQFIQCVQEICQ